MFLTFFLQYPMKSLFQVHEITPSPPPTTLVPPEAKPGARPDPVWFPPVSPGLGGGGAAGSGVPKICVCTLQIKPLCCNHNHRIASQSQHPASISRSPQWSPTPVLTLLFNLCSKCFQNAWGRLREGLEPQGQGQRQGQVYHLPPPPPPPPPPPAHREV